MKYSFENLPKFVAGSSGVALPKPGATVAFCAVPVDTSMMTPWGQVLEAKAGRHYHLAIDPMGDHYPNDEFETFYEIGEALNPLTDTRAAFLAGYWSGKGFAAIEIREASKTKSAIVVGVLAEVGEFENVEGTAPFEAGDVLLESPDIKGRMWPVKAATFAKKYLPIEPTTV